MAALLGTVPLVFKVDSGSSSIDHELGEAHHCSHATVARVAVGNDGAEVVGTACATCESCKAGRKAALDV